MGEVDEKGGSSKFESLGGAIAPSHLRINFGNTIHGGASSQVAAFHKLQPRLFVSCQQSTPTLPLLVKYQYQYPSKDETSSCLAYANLCPSWLSTQQQTL